MPVALLVALVGLAVHFILFFGVKVPLEEPDGDNEGAGFAIYGESVDPANALYAEQALLEDSKPLFMPTRWNVASDLQEIARLRDETELFRPYAPIVQLASVTDFVGLAPVPDVGATLSDRLSANPLYPLAGFGEGASSDAGPLPPRRAELTWARPKDGAVGQLEVSLEGLPEGPEELWSPAIFWVVIDPSLDSVTPMRLTSSGFPWWDAAIRDFLRTRDLARRLEPGYYRVTVGP